MIEKEYVFVVESIKNQIRNAQHKAILNASDILPPLSLNN